MSQDRKKSKKGSSEASGAEQATEVKLSDPSSAKLLQKGRSLGNDELKRRIDKGTATRDDLLLFLTQRLQTVREVQLREMALTPDDAQRTWWKDVSDIHKEDVTKPEPKRWRESAAIYEEAAYQLCRGALDRGAQLVERAVDAERKAFGSLTSLVELSDVETEAQHPEVIKDIKIDEACAAADVPLEIRELARSIHNVEAEARTPMNRKRKRDPWWTLEEEEEEEEDGASDGS